MAQCNGWPINSPLHLCIGTNAAQDRIIEAVKKAECDCTNVLEGLRVFAPSSLSSWHSNTPEVDFYLPWGSQQTVYEVFIKLAMTTDFGVGLGIPPADPHLHVDSIAKFDPAGRRRVWIEQSKIPSGDYNRQEREWAWIWQPEKFSAAKRKARTFYSVDPSFSDDRIVAQYTDEQERKRKQQTEFILIGGLTGGALGYVSNEKPDWIKTIAYAVVGATAGYIVDAIAEKLK